MSYIDDQLQKIINELSDDEKRVLEYFIQNISVGTIISLRELKALYKIVDPKIVIRNLIDKGLLEQGYGCYNLAKPLREALYLILRSHD